MSKSIGLPEDAYERLAAHKRDDETFSEVVLRLAGGRSLLEIAGVLSDEEADEPVLTRNVDDSERPGADVETY